MFSEYKRLFNSVKSQNIYNDNLDSLSIFAFVTLTNVILIYSSNETSYIDFE